MNKKTLVVVLIFAVLTVSGCDEDEQPRVQPYVAVQRYKVKETQHVDWNRRRAQRYRLQRIEELERQCQQEQLTLDQLNHQRVAQLRKYWLDLPGLQNDCSYEQFIALLFLSTTDLGMTSSRAKLKFGSPQTVNYSVGSWGTHAQWVYRRFGRQYLYFENGKLTSYQD